MCSVLWYCPCGNRPLQDGGKGTDRGRQGLTRPLGGGVEEGLHCADAAVGIRVRTGQIGAIPGGQATCASAIALQKSEIEPCSFFLPRSRELQCCAANKRKKKQNPRKKLDEVATRFGPGEERMRFERAAKQQAVQFFLCLCVSADIAGKTRLKITLKDLFCCVCLEPGPAWDAVERGKDPGLGISRV